VSAAVPIRPLLAPWYRIVGDGDRLLLEHARSVVVLEGVAVRTLLPQVLPLLDGTRTVSELAERLGAVAREALDAALELLADHGLLVEGLDVSAMDRPAIHAAAASFGLSPSAASTRLAGTSVGVVGSAPAGSAVARLLHAGGVPDVRRLSWRGGRAVDLAVVAPGCDELDALPAWNRRALDEGIRWLEIRPFDGLISTVGPLIVPGESCCYECVLLRFSANSEYGGDLAELESAPSAAVPDAGLDALTAGLAAHLALRWVVGRDTTLPGLLHVIEVRPSLVLTLHEVLRVPRCGSCSTSERIAPRLPWHEAVVEAA